MAKNVQDFKQILTHGGARPNLFEVQIQFPNTTGANIIDAFKAPLSNGQYQTAASFLVKAANIPASNIGSIPVDYRGRKLPVPGDRTFDPWTVTVQNDGDFNIRAAFETWSRGINALTENVSQLIYAQDNNPAKYQFATTPNRTTYYADLVVYQLARDGITPSRNPQNIVNGNPGAGAAATNGYVVIRAYKFVDAWCSNVSAIDLNYGDNDRIEDFTVQFEYSYYEAIDVTQFKAVQAVNDIGTGASQVL